MKLHSRTVLRESEGEHRAKIPSPGESSVPGGNPGKLPGRDKIKDTTLKSLLLKY